MTYEILQGDCRVAMRLLVDDESVDSIVTDPPYELGFMGKGWDATGVANDVNTWREAYRVLKPGGHLLAFSGTRTYHRMVCAIEDAGFEIRDQIGWVYGSGFPKSLDVSKAIDKAAGAEREVVGERTFSGKAAQDWRDKGSAFTAGGPSSAGCVKSVEVTAPATDAARQWQGWGTALKPAWEPIVVARKPLIGTVAANVLRHGTGALNIDGCRVEGPGGAKWETPRGGIWLTDSDAAARLVQNDLGRWPANLIHDGSDEVLAAFPQAPGQLADARNDGEAQGNKVYGAMRYSRAAAAARGDTGSAARFFYCAKASKSDRGEGNTHPTVKPTDLMRYLCRLVTPPGGLVLDPFLGSGSTGKAAVLEGFRFLGIDMCAEYIAIAEHRIAAALASIARKAA